MKTVTYGMICVGYISLALRTSAQPYTIHTTYPGTSIPLHGGNWMNSNWEFVGEYNGLDAVRGATTFRTLQPAPGWPSSTGVRIRDDGIVLGLAGNGEYTRLFSWSVNGQPRDLGFGDIETGPTSVVLKRFLDRGDLLYTRRDSNWNIFDIALQHDGTYYDLPAAPSGSHSWAMDINSSGVATGWDRTGPSSGYAVRRWADGRVDTLSAQFTPLKINENGDVGGWMDEGDYSHLRFFSWRADGTVHIFENRGITRGHATSAVSSVLPTGEIVFTTYRDGLWGEHWVGKRDGSSVLMRDWLGLPSTVTQPVGTQLLNANGRLGGSYLNAAGNGYVVFVADPVPEPASLLALGGGLLALLRKQRRS